MSDRGPRVKIRRFRGEKGSIQAGFSLRRRKDPNPFPSRKALRTDSGRGSRAVFRLDRSIRRRRLKNPFIKRILTYTQDQGKSEGDGSGLFLV